MTLGHDVLILLRDCYCVRQDSLNYEPLTMQTE